MLDQAGYESKNHSAFLNLQYLAGSRTEIFATTMFNSGTATIRDFVYDSSNIIPGTALPAGALDFALMSSTFAGFSDLDYRNVTQTLGANVRLSNNVLLTGTFYVGDLNDATAYLYDATGRRVGFAANVNYVF